MMHTHNNFISMRSLGLLAALVAPMTVAAACGGGDDREEGDDTSLAPNGDGDGDGDSDGGAIKLDALNETGNGNGGNSGNDLDDGVPYIWIANSAIGQVSKINTVTMVEEGRYWTSADGNGDPSRTSVSLSGNVAVANRSGGLIKIVGDAENCPNSNGTSTGADDVIQYPDDCVAWYLETDFESQRAVAWTSGEADVESQVGVNEKIWLAGEYKDKNTVTVMLIDGDSGGIQDQTDLNLGITDEDSPGAKFPYRAYGGAVDRDSNFWFATFGNDGKIVRVGRDGLGVDMWPKPHFSYGFTVDGEGRPWSCGVVLARFDPDSGTWTSKGPAEVGLSSITAFDFGGCMVDNEEKRMWAPVKMDLADTRFGLASFDRETLEGISVVELPKHVHGVSIDKAHQVWGVTGVWGGDADGTEVYRINPETLEFDTYSGLSGAYTYSDMTGFALTQTWIPPVG